MKVSWLKDKTGSPTKQLKHFKVELRNALETLHSVLGWSVEWDGDLVKITRTPSDAQARYLERVDSRRKALEDSQPAIFRPVRARAQAVRKTKAHELAPTKFLLGALSKAN